MLEAGVAERLADLRCAGERRTDAGALDVEHAERARRALLPRFVVERRVVRVEPLDELLDVGRAAVRVADRVELQLPLLHAEPPEHLDVQLDHLCVDRRVVGADRLDRLLPMLAIAALLRRRVPVHRRLRVQLHGLRLPLHSVLEVGAADRRRPLGSQREPSTALVLEDVHLLLHHVGALAGRAEEELGVLEHRRDDPAVAVRLGDLGERARGELPERLLRREDVVGPARRLELHWEAERSSARKGLRSSSAPSVVAEPVARVHDRLRRIPLGEQADRVEQRVPVPAGEVDAADAAGEQDVAREEAPVRVIGKVSGRVAGDVEDVEADARELEGVSPVT